MCVIALTIFAEVLLFAFLLFFGRYVISNACSKPLCYKQKGTDFVFHLGVGQHSHLHWIDTTR